MKHKITLVLIIIFQLSFGQTASNFWENVQFGGGLGLNFGSGLTEISVAPSAKYNITNQFAVGLGLQGSYVNSYSYKSTIYGGSGMIFFNPIEDVQLSVEIEQMYVKNTIKDIPEIKSNFWNTGLFLGAGYSVGSFVVGTRYNVLYDKNKNIYNSAFMPFVRVFF